MRILSIETSCDDTGISIIEAKGGATSASFRVLANNISSQIELHAPFGGVYPALAKREHLKNFPLLLEKTLRQAGLSAKKFSPVDLIAVTYGPGLEPTLWTGITFAQELAKKWKIPVIPVNHMEGHIFSVFAKGKSFKIPNIKLPALALLVSGGHTELVLIKKWMNYEIIGQTLDDAVGEAFDKVARMLGLPYPGGPQISKLAEELRGKKINFSLSLPRPMLKSKDFNFSYSGLKTAVLYLVRDIGKLDDDLKAKIALEFENAAIECLAHKTARALEKHKTKTLIVGGGVAANRHLLREIKKITRKAKVKLFSPGEKLTGDNSLMIGIAGYLNYIKNKKKTPGAKSIKAVGNLRL